MQIMKNIFIWFCGLAFGVGSSILIFFYVDDTLYRIDPSNVPDTPTAYLMGGFIGAFLGIIFNVIIFFIFLLLICLLKRKVLLANFVFSSANRLSQKIAQISGYLLMINFVIRYVYACIIYQTFHLSEFLYYVTAIITTCFYIILLVSILERKKSKVIKNG